MIAEGQSERTAAYPRWTGAKRPRESDPSQQGPLGNPYNVQYASLILILLTVTVGSFSPQNREAPVSPAPPSHSERPALATVPLRDLFSDNSSEPTEDGLGALHELLNRHDIRARLVLPLETRQTELSFHRFQSMTRAALDSGIGAELLAVELDERVKDAPLLIIGNDSARLFNESSSPDVKRLEDLGDLGDSTRSTLVSSALAE